MIEIYNYNKLDISNSLILYKILNKHVDIV